MSAPSQLPQVLRDIVNHDLAGYELREVYYAEPNHGLMATMPLIIWPRRVMVVTLDEVFLKRIVAEIRTRGEGRIEYRTMLALVNLEMMCGVSLGEGGGRQAQLQRPFFPLFSEYEYQQLLEQKGKFKGQELVWA